MAYIYRSENGSLTPTSMAYASDLGSNYGADGGSALAIAAVTNGAEQEIVFGMPECDGAGGRVGVFTEPSAPLLLQERSQLSFADSLGIPTP